MVLDLVANYNPTKFEVAILSLYDKADTIYEKELEKIGAKVFYLDKKPGLDVSIVMKTLKYLICINQRLSTRIGM